MHDVKSKRKSNTQRYKVQWWLRGVRRAQKGSDIIKGYAMFQVFAMANAKDLMYITRIIIALILILYRMCSD